MQVSLPLRGAAVAACACTFVRNSLHQSGADGAVADLGKRGRAGPAGLATPTRTLGRRRDLGGGALVALVVAVVVVVFIFFFFFAFLSVLTRATTATGNVPGKVRQGRATVTTGQAKGREGKGRNN